MTMTKIPLEKDLVRIWSWSPLIFFFIKGCDRVGQPQNRKTQKSRKLEKNRQKMEENWEKKRQTTGFLLFFAHFFLFSGFRGFSILWPADAVANKKGGKREGVSQRKLLSGGYCAMRGIAAIVSPIAV